MPDMAETAGARFDRLVDIMRRLRAPDGCPWDREQTLASLRPFVLEETYEVLEAIESGSPAHLREELGDFLFEAVFLAQISDEAGDFTIADAIDGICDKLVRRHPHVFARAPEETSVDELLVTWEQLKKAETGHASVMDGLTDALPSLLWAHKVLRKADSTGHPWSPGSDPSFDADDLGDQLLALVSVARSRDVDPETALRTSASRLRDQVRAAGG